MITRRRLIEAAPWAVAAAAVGSESGDATEAPPPPLKLDVSVCFDSGTLLWVPLRIVGAPDGLMHRPLRRLEDGSLRSAVVRIPAGWTTPGPVAFDTQVQFFVLTGELQLGEVTLPKFGYASLPAHYGLGRLSSPASAEFLLICTADPHLQAAPVATATQASDATFVLHPPTDRTTRLWQDKITGANTSLIVAPPGWDVEGPEYHPCQEEIFLVAGDMSPDDIRLMNKPGWFLWNPPFGVHGWHIHSVAGGTVLEWHDRPYGRAVYRG
jgi:hypothetical protein